MTSDLSTCAEELPAAQGLGIGRHRQLQNIEEHIGDVLGAAESKVAASLLLGQLLNLLQAPLKW